MKRIIWIIILCITLTLKVSANNIYNGTFIDAHSQVGPLITNELVSKQIIKNGVDLTLLSIRGKSKTATERYISVNKLSKNKVRYLVPTKLKGFTRKKLNDDVVIKNIKYLKKDAIRNNVKYVGFGEIILQHAPHNHKKLKYEGINRDFKSKRISRAINIVLKDNKPVILHIELNDYEKDSKKILSQLVELSKRYPNNNFLLIHMAQAEFSEVEFIIRETKNIHFMTSTADNATQRKIKQGKAQIGWINLFDKNDNLQKKWVNLMNKNPKRFVLTLDNVFDVHWLRDYGNKVYLWRKALASLNKDSALQIACGNANTYFRLNIKCLKVR